MTACYLLGTKTRREQAAEPVTAADHADTGPG